MTTVVVVTPTKFELSLSLFPSFPPLSSSSCLPSSLLGGVDILLRSALRKSAPRVVEGRGERERERERERGRREREEGEREREREKQPMA